MAVDKFEAGKRYRWIGSGGLRVGTFTANASGTNLHGVTLEYSDGTRVCVRLLKIGGGGTFEEVAQPELPPAAPKTGLCTPYHDAARAAASLVVEKQKAYGDSFGRSGEVLRILYPDGIPPEKLDDALTVVRVLDKLFRIATDRDALGESPWRDVLGYALLAVVRQEGVTK